MVTPPIFITLTAVAPPLLMVPLSFIAPGPAKVIVCTPVLFGLLATATPVPLTVPAMLPMIFSTFPPADTTCVIKFVPLFCRVMAPEKLAGAIAAGQGSPAPAANR